MPAHWFKHHGASGKKETGKTAQESHSRTLGKFIVVLGILAFVLIVIFVASPIKSRAAFSGANGKIAFQTFRDGHAQIYVMNADGTGQTNLSNNPANDYAPKWSPDGTKIVFSSDRSGHLQIYVMNADGSGQINLSNSLANDNTPAWSPTGAQIAFTSDRDGNQEIYVMNADGSNQTNLTNNPAYDNGAAWSPDGTKIAFSSDRAGPYFVNDIYVMNADGTGVTNLTNNPSNDAAPAWSPDGAKIAFYTNRDGNWEVYVMDASGTGQMNLTNNPATDISPAWSPDGAKILFVTNRDGNDEVYVMNANGSGQANLTNNVGAEGWPDWQPFRYNFSGFFQPIDNNLLNVAKAGSAIPVKFSLSGNQGLGIMASGYPSSQLVTCGSSATDAIEETVTAGSSSLSYDPTSDQYIYVWKTDRLWAGTCRTLVVKLIDGTFHYANFKFTK